MTRTLFREKTFDPLAEGCMENLLSYVDKERSNIAISLTKTLDRISAELPAIHLPRAKYISLSLLRTHLITTGEFLYSAYAFDSEFVISEELSKDCFYNASWMTECYKEFSEIIANHVNKSMIKHSPSYVKELMAEVVSGFNLCFVNTAKDLLEEYSNDSLQGFLVLVGDYIFSINCLTFAKYDKIKE